MNETAAAAEPTTAPDPDQAGAPIELPDVPPAQVGSFPMRELPLDLITRDKGLQARVRLDKELVLTLRDAVKNKEERRGDPAVVFHYMTKVPTGKKDKEGNAIEEDQDVYLLADGWHWFQAHEEEGKKKIRVQVREGNRVDALRYALSANAFHGKNRTTEDKERAITLALENLKALVGKANSNKAISRLTHTSESLVKRVREDWEKLTGNKDEVRTGADGRTRGAHRKPKAGERDHAKQVRATQEKIGAAKSPEAIRVPQPGAVKPKGATDIVGREIPEVIAHVFASNVSIDALLAVLRNAKGMTEHLRTTGALAWGAKSIEANIQAAYDDLAVAKPALVCDKCGGEGCGACKVGGQPVGYFSVGYFDGLKKEEKEALAKAAEEANEEGEE